MSYIRVSDVNGPAFTTPQEIIPGVEKTAFESGSEATHTLNHRYASKRSSGCGTRSRATASTSRCAYCAFLPLIVPRKR